MAADMRRAADTTAESSTAVALLYERYSERILAYCVHTLRDRTEAEDAVQTTFLHAQRALRRGVTPEHEFAWLHTIAKNACRTQRRTSARRAVVSGVDLDAYPATSDAAAEKELRRVLGDALGTLPESQRRALVMREWQGLSSAEIASRMGLSTPATYALLTRARRSLVHALTTVKGRSALGLNVWPLLARLKTLLAGGAGKVATATALGVVVAAGGTTAEWALADPPKDSVAREQRAFESAVLSTTPVSTERTTRPIVSANRRTDALREAVTGARGGGVPTSAPEQPGAEGAASPRLPEAAADTPPEPTPAVEVPPTVDHRLDPLLDPVPELPLPDVDLEPVLTEVVPVDTLPPVDGSALPEVPPVQVPPLPDLPPVP